ncbi:PAS domain S-box protein [Salisaeta longa]|uniref:PAS domain S-box protein n=1 Tax=Salisaeta longa TaxID=503170 RepID=UPI0003B5F064|nr:PAS domain S-box protein [Salisaeta longa]
MDVLLCAASPPDALIARLKARGHRVHVCATPPEALRFAQQNDPALAFFAATAPEGLRFCQAARAQCPAMATIAYCLEDACAPGRIQAVFTHGADDCLRWSDDVPRMDTRLAFLEQHLATRPRPETLAAHRPAIIAEIGRRALASTALDVLMAYAVHTISDVLDAPFCKVLRHEPAQACFVLEAGVGWDDGTLGTACTNDGTDSQAGFTLQSAEPVIVDDLTHEARFAAPSLLTSHNIRSGISVTITSTPRPYGVLGAHAPTPAAFTSADAYFLQSVANVLAGAVERVQTEDALRESRAKAHAILETTVDGVITIDAKGHITSFNAAAEDIFGYSEAEVLGENVKMLMPSPYHEEHDGYMQSYHDTGRAKIIGIGREVTGKRRDGSTFPMDLAVSEVMLDDRHLFTGIVRDISERRRLEQEILSISEQERRRIGQDLHDGLGQMLTGTGLLSQSLAKHLAREDHPRAEDAAEITELIKEADQYARDLSRGLTPVDLEAEGLAEALRRLSDNAKRLFDVGCTFEEVGTVLVHDDTAATHLYRIAQEAVSNAVRHGDAAHLKIILAAGTDQVRLRIHDDGDGFDPAAIEGPGMGVHIMHYRARIIGGTLDISSAPANGTTVTCTLPRRHPTAPTPAHH